MTDKAAFVIVGAGLAGAKAVETLRDIGFDGDITLIGAEAHRPYERPPLSKDYLQGNATGDKLYVHSPAWYAEHQVELRLTTTVTAVDRDAHQVVTSGGERVRYDKLLLATGSSPRRLSVPGAELDNVLYLRTLEDSDRIKQALGPGVRVVVIGAGWIGLETAAAARAAGADVTVLENAGLPLQRVLGSRIAHVFADLHRDNGVDLRCDVSVAGIRATTDGRSVAEVELADGTRVPANIVIVGVGATPNVELASASGLQTDNGVVVDQQLRTSDPDVYAAGDIANAYHPFLGRHLRVEHWANALHQPVVAANAMIGGDSVYERLPYFFTDQYDLGMEYTGQVEPGDTDGVVIRGDLGSREFIAFWTRDRRILAGMNVNVWDVTATIKQLIQSRKEIDVERLMDLEVPLDDLLD
jgi:3-phenylpropionate/trans-cinnamate dioxygenase ferredoxin reductase component